MTKVIYKYEINVNDANPMRVVLPIDFKFIRSACFRPDVVTLWYEHDANPDTDIEEEALYVVGTGMPVPEDSEHLTSVVYNDGVLVWHVYRQL